MKNEGFTPGKGAERKAVQESTPQESGVFERYVDLRLSAYDALMSDEERKNFEQELTDVVRILNKGTGIDSVVRENLLRKIHTIEQDYLRIKKIVEVVKELERESRGNILVPHLYRKSVSLIKAALDNGVPHNTLEPFQEIIEDYLHRVQSQSTQ